MSVDLYILMAHATIERCAKTAEKYIGIGAERDNIMARTIAAAIRKLKDDKQPDPNLIYPGKDRDFVFPEE